MTNPFDGPWAEKETNPNPPPDYEVHDYKIETERPPPLYVEPDAAPPSPFDVVEHSAELRADIERTKFLAAHILQTLSEHSNQAVAEAAAIDAAVDAENAWALAQEIVRRNG